MLNAEQVSHHPPLTAYNIDCASKGISFEGHCAQKTSFSSGAIVVKQIGHGIIRLRLPSGTEETYLVTLPKLQVAGLFYGAPYVELSEKSYIQASTGYQATIEYKGKGESPCVVVSIEADEFVQVTFPESPILSSPTSPRPPPLLSTR